MKSKQSEAALHPTLALTTPPHWALFPSRARPGSASFRSGCAEGEEQNSPSAHSEELNSIRWYELLLRHAFRHRAMGAEPSGSVPGKQPACRNVGSHELDERQRMPARNSRRCTVACGVALVAAMTLFVLPAYATDYYISSQNGDDDNNGTSPSSAWATFAHANATTFQPGDHILLERGSVWNGTILSPRGSGEEGAPIVITSYGRRGGMPRINANGIQSTYNGASSAVIHDPTYYPNFAYGSGAVTLFNQQYWEIKNLELTNMLSGTFDPSNKANNFSGVRVWARGAGTLNHIYISGNHIHDVTGEVSWSGDRAESKRTGGIVIYTWDYNSETSHTRFNDIQVDHNVLSNVSMDAIGIQQASKTNLYSDRASYGDDSTYTPYTNVRVYGNTIDNQMNNDSSDGIQLIGVQFGHVYDNLILGGGTVGIETDFNDQTRIEHNEVAFVKQHYVNGGGVDHAGIDTDAESSNVIVQRNYVHDNGEGIILDAFTFGYNNFVRYNLIADNDIGPEGTAPNTIPGDQLRVAAENGSSFVDNNTVFDRDTVLPIFSFNQPKTKGDVASYFIQNNIFDGGIGSWPGGTAIVTTFINNDYYRNGTPPSGETHAITSSPVLLLPGLQDAGSAPGVLPVSAYGYLLFPWSPLLCVGVDPIEPSSGPMPEPLHRDIFDHLIGSPPSIGAASSFLELLH